MHREIITDRRFDAALNVRTAGTEVAAPEMDREVRGDMVGVGALAEGVKVAAIGEVGDYQGKLQLKALKGHSAMVLP